MSKQTSDTCFLEQNPPGMHTNLYMLSLSQVYSIENSTLCLTGTAEVPLGAYYMDQILPEEQLPIKMVAFGHCFRTEAGAAGIDCLSALLEGAVFLEASSQACLLFSAH